MGALIMAMAGLCGCLLAPGHFSSTKTFQGADTIVLPAPRTDIFDVLSKTAKSLGYRVSGLNRQFRNVSFASQSSMGSGLLLGKYSSATINITVGEDNKTLNINITLSGNLGSGGQEAADKRIAEFKNALNKTITN